MFRFRTGGLYPLVTFGLNNGGVAVRAAGAFGQGFAIRGAGNGFGHLRLPVVVPQLGKALCIGFLTYLAGVSTDAVFCAGCFGGNGGGIAVAHKGQLLCLDMTAEGAGAFPDACSDAGRDLQNFGGVGVICQRNRLRLLRRAANGAVSYLLTFFQAGGCFGDHRLAC